MFHWDLDGNHKTNVSKTPAFLSASMKARFEWDLRDLNLLPWNYSARLLYRSQFLGKENISESGCSVVTGELVFGCLECGSLLQGTGTVARCIVGLKTSNFWKREATLRQSPVVKEQVLWEESVLDN